MPDIKYIHCQVSIVEALAVVKVPKYIFNVAKSNNMVHAFQFKNNFLFSFHGYEPFYVPRFLYAR
jgi:hypothetical protein